LASITKRKPDKGKKWITREEHDLLGSQIATYDVSGTRVEDLPGSAA
jgi:hypothetical protein